MSSSRCQLTFPSPLPPAWPLLYQQCSSLPSLPRAGHSSPARSRGASVQSGCSLPRPSVSDSTSVLLSPDTASSSCSSVPPAHQSAVAPLGPGSSLLFHTVTPGRKPGPRHPMQSLRLTRHYLPGAPTRLHPCDPTARLLTDPSWTCIL